VQKRQALIPFPRTGKRASLIPFPRTGKRASLIPFPRTGKRATPSSLIRELPDTYENTAENSLGMENFYGGDRPSSRDYETMQAIQNFLRELQIDN